MNARLNKIYIREGLEIEAEKAGMSAEDATVFIDSVIEFLGEPTPRPAASFFNIRKYLHQKMSEAHDDYEGALKSILKNPRQFAATHKGSGMFGQLGWFVRPVTTTPPQDDADIDTDVVSAPEQTQSAHKNNNPVQWQSIEASARATLAATGQRMKQHGGMIQHGPLKGVLSETAVHIAIRDGYHGLEKGLFKGLADFQDQCGIPDTKLNNGGVRGDILNLSDIGMALRLAYLIDRRRLTKNDGIIQYGVLAGQSCTAIDLAFKRGNRGLKDCGFKSLAELADHLKIPANPHHASSLESRMGKLRFTIEEAVETLSLHIEHDERVPIADKTPVTRGKIAGLKMTFAALNVSIGRQKDLHGFSGIKDLMAAHCGETAFWYAPDSKLAKEFAAGAGVQYDEARKTATIDLIRIFMGPPAPAHLHKPERTADTVAVQPTMMRA